MIAASAWTRPEPMLVTGVGGIYCALPITHVVETMRPLPIEPISRADPSLPFLCGLAKVRGSTIAVIDIARLLGRVAGSKSRFVIARTALEDTGNAAPRTLALIVDEVVGVRSFDATTLAELPSLARHASGDVVTAVGALERGLVVVLEIGRVVPEPALAALAHPAP